MAPTDIAKINPDSSRVQLQPLSSRNVPAYHVPKNTPCQNCVEKKTIANAIAHVAPAVVHIVVPGWREGSGTIIHKDGIILTCCHILGDRRNFSTPEKVEVTLHDGRKVEGKMINAYKDSDIALVKICSESIYSFSTAKLGSSFNLQTGDWVIAMGSPHSLQKSATIGIISHDKRGSKEIHREGGCMDYIQTDCAINEGNSGGPLINIDGEVVGVNTIKKSDYLKGGKGERIAQVFLEGVSFAARVDSLVYTMDNFRNNSEACFGFEIVYLDRMFIAALEEKNPVLGSHLRQGIFVCMVTKGSLAERAGVQQNDVILMLDGKPATTITEVIKALHRKGDAVQVAIWRSGLPVSLTLNCNRNSRL